jgi:hypothetical protein
MRLRWLLLALVLFPAVALVPAATGAGQVTSGTGVLTGPTKDTLSDKLYTLTITNTGDQPITCFQLLLPAGVKMLSIRQPPPGWQLGAPSQPPATALYGKGAPGIPPGGKAQFTFATDVSYPVDGGADLKLSADCKTDITVRATGPAAEPPPPPPAPKKCVCKDLKARMCPTGSSSAALRQACASRSSPSGR